MLINNTEFALAHQRIKHDIDVSRLKRANELADGLSGTLTFEIDGDVGDKPVLNVYIYGKISTLCQVCLDPVEIKIDHKGSVEIFGTEAELDEALFGENAKTSDGILAETEFNVLDFIEDEIIMLLPLAPKHVSCNYVPSGTKRHNPFEILKKQIN